MWTAVHINVPGASLALRNNQNLIVALQNVKGRRRGHEKGKRQNAARAAIHRILRAIGGMFTARTPHGRKARNDRSGVHLPKHIYESTRAASVLGLPKA